MSIFSLASHLLSFSSRELLLFFRYKIFGHKMIRLEASSMCQLQCPACPTGQRKTKELKVGWGTLTFDHFKSIVDNNPKIKYIELSNWGEIFLNPELKKIIEYAFLRDIHLSANNGVNLNSLTQEMAQLLVKFRFRSMTISIDGASQDTYVNYRRNGNFKKVIENIESINRYKTQYGSKYPNLRWQFVVFGHNQHEIPLARDMAKRLGMRFFTKQNWSAQYSPTQGTQKHTPSQGNQTEAPYILSYCNQLWISPQVNWDGTLLGCCVNRTVSFGNVFETGLENCLNSESYRYLKRMVAGKADARANMPCLGCRYYRGRKLGTPRAN